MFEPVIPNDPMRNGRKLFSAGQVCVTARIPAPPIGKKVFPHQCTLYQQTDQPMSPRAIHEWTREDTRMRMIAPPSLEFTKAQKAWSPMGGSGSHGIPEPPPSPREGSTPQKVTSNEPSQRLMSRPTRPVLSEKLPVPTKKISVAQFTARMEQDIKLRTIKQSEAAGKQQKSESVKRGNSDPDEAASSEKRDMAVVLHRLVDEPLLHKKKKLEELTRKLCSAPHSATSPRKLNASEMSASTSRLYREGVEHQRKTMQSVARKYIDDVAPKFSVKPAAEIEEYSAKLFDGTSGSV